MKKDEKIEELKNRLEKDVRIPDGWKVTGYTLLMQLTNGNEYATAESTDCENNDFPCFISYEVCKLSRIMGRSTDDVLDLIKELINKEYFIKKFME